MAGTASETHASEPEGAHGTRRDFLKILTVASAAVAGCALAWPFIDALAPGQDAAAAAKVAVDVGAIAPGAALSVVWRGKPVFIRHLTDAELDAAENTPLADLRDPVAFRWRTHPGFEHYVVVIGRSPSDGCVPLGTNPGEPRGPFGGWTSPCDGSVFDTAGRVRAGPARENLALPPYDFVSATRLVIG